jgi:hypothetical protein
LPIHGSFSVSGLDGYQNQVPSMFVCRSVAVSAR